MEAAPQVGLVQGGLSACLDSLMRDVGRNLEAKNRDKFTQVSLMQMPCVHAPALSDRHESPRHAFWHVQASRKPFATCGVT